MKAVAFTKAAWRSWRKLPQAVQDRIEAALNRYAETGEGDVKKLATVEGARLRVGDYRAIFIETEEEIEIFAVGHRKDIYR
jgi:mRNA interferase RelE/StbE